MCLTIQFGQKIILSFILQIEHGLIKSRYSIGPNSMRKVYNYTWNKNKEDEFGQHCRERSEIVQERIRLVQE